MNILITGGAGFLGSHLARRLSAEGHRITILDDLSTGRLCNITDQRIAFIEGDVETYSIASESYDQIYNLACPASPPAYQRNPIKTINTSFRGMTNVLNSAVVHGSRVLQASTSEIYGDPLVHPQKEDYWGNVNPIGIRSCYDEGKRIAETLCADYHRTYATEVRIMRIFNTYGPNMDPKDGRVVSNFIMQALKNEPITIYGDGSQTRSFCYVSDLVDGMIRLMNSNVTYPVNIGNPVEFTVLQLAELVMEMTGSKSSINRLPLPSDDPTRRRPNIDRASALLGWSPKVSLEQGLKPTIEYFSKCL